MDGSQVGVLEEGDEVSLSGLLEGHNGGGLEAEIRLCGGNDDDNQQQHSQPTLTTMTTYLEVLSNLTDETLEGEFANEQVGRLLVFTDFTKSDSSGAETMGLLDTTGGSLRVNYL